MTCQVSPKSPQHNRRQAEIRLVCAQARLVSNKYLSQYQLPEPTQKLPVLNLGDIRRGEVLGSGGYGTVYAVKSIDSCTDDEDSMDSIDTVKDNKYAIKVLNAKVMINDDDLFNALVDNATEAKLLCSMDHPNIIKIQAIPACGMFSECSFLLMDRLECTLRERLREWKPNAFQKRIKGILGNVLKRDSRGQKEATFWNKRMQYAVALASALAYMHSHRVVHRDLKPENIGLDREDNIKILDFGIARQLPQPESSDETHFKMTGYCGSPRFMAPEVALNHRYNEKVDVYSLTLVVWEILSLETPFMGVNKQYLMTSVWRGRHVRPKVNPSWSPSLRDLLIEGWHRDAAKRPSMAEITNRLGREGSLCKVESTSPTKAQKARLQRNPRQALSKEVPITSGG